MNPLGKLPEAPSAKFDVNGVDMLKVFRDWIMTAGAAAVTGATAWLAIHQGMPLVINGHDYTMEAAIVTPLIVKPLLETARRYFTNGAAPDAPPQPPVVQP